MSKFINMPHNWGYLNPDHIVHAFDEPVHDNDKRRLVVLTSLPGVSFDRMVTLDQASFFFQQLFAVK